MCTEGELFNSYFACEVYRLGVHGQGARGEGGDDCQGLEGEQEGFLFHGFVLHFLFIFWVAAGEIPGIIFTRTGWTDYTARIRLSLLLIKIDPPARR